MSNDKPKTSHKTNGLNHKITSLDEEGFNLIFMEARTYNAWQERPVDDKLLRKLFDLMVLAPTSANCLPARIVFVKSQDAKNRLKDALASGNVEKTMAAPVTAIVGYDLEFYKELPRTFPHAPQMVEMFQSSRELSDTTAFRNGSLQGGYMILAARSLGLDCGPMSGFDNAKVDELFFKGSTIKSNFLCNIGYGNPEGLHPRAPRLSFEEACQTV